MLVMEEEPFGKTTQQPLILGKKELFFFSKLYPIIFLMKLLSYGFLLLFYLILFLNQPTNKLAS